MVVEGDKVSLNVTGRVTKVVTDGERTAVWFRDEQGREFAALEDQVDTVEDWQVGDVVLDADGDVYRRTHGLCWLEPGSGDVCPDHEPLRPLQLLVRAGVKCA